jgi:hypothetical protein
MTVYLSSTFSLNRIIGRHELVVHSEGIEYVKSLLAQGFTSIVGDKFKAKVVELRLGMPVRYSKQSVTLWSGDILVVASIPKLPKWWKRDSEDALKQIPIDWYIFEFK